MKLPTGINMVDPTSVPLKGKDRTMSKPYRTGRRELFRQGLAVAALGALGGVSGPKAAADDAAGRSERKTKIRIGGRINPAWLKSQNDNDLRFLRQLGVDRVDITLDMVEGYGETSCFTKAALTELINRLDAVGLRIERANSFGHHYLSAHLNRPEGQQEIDNLKSIGELLAEAEIPVFGIQACQASLHTQGARRGWSRESGRGGYQYPAFELQRSEGSGRPPKYRVTAEGLWKGLLNIYRQVIPVIEGSKTRVAMHGNDPPLYEYLGSPQILCRFADFDRLFSEVPSQHSGITFCVGTRYESGQDVLEGIRHFGRQGKLFHVHFRNVRGTLPADGGYAEVFLDDGDMNMAKVLRALDAAGYDGVIDYDHTMGVTGDGPLPKQYIAFAVGYMRGLLQSLEG
jgi:mannonate dehydratase